MQNVAVDDHSVRGRPRKTWEHVIMEDLRVKDSDERLPRIMQSGDLPLHDQSMPMLAWNNNGLKNDDDDDKYSEAYKITLIGSLPYNKSLLYCSQYLFSVI